MKLATKGRAATVTALGTIVLIGVMIWWAQIEVEDADKQRRRTTEIARALNDLRLVSFEFILYRTERARQQEQAVAKRLDELLTQLPFSAPEPQQILKELSERVAETHQIFDELQRTLPAATVAGGPASGTDSAARLDEQLSRKLLVLQQESLVDAFRLSEYSSARIGEAQRRVEMVSLVGLVLIAAATAGAAWIIHVGVLAPIQRLEQATREVAAGNLNYRLDIAGDDEVGEMSRNFDAMTTAMRAAFAQLERNNHELVALNKEIEAFSFSVSHDLRAPLRSMDGFSLALLEDYEDVLDAEGRDYLQRIRAASQRMGKLIDDLLGLSRVTRTELAVRSVDLSLIASDIAASLAQQEPSRQVQWLIEDHVVVDADKSLAQIALQNLLENAWKFTAKAEQATIRIGQTTHDGAVVCFVADNGVGFDMTYADRLFGAFQRLHHETEFKGTGIGLAIVQRIVRRHEGRIWAEAQPNLGATFFFTFREHTT
jgi:signal transduction histidine kinase